MYNNNKFFINSLLASFALLLLFSSAPITADAANETVFSCSSGLPQVFLDWDEALGATSYEVRRSGAVIATVLAPQTFYTDSGLNVSSSYTIVPNNGAASIAFNPNLGVCVHNLSISGPTSLIVGNTADYTANFNYYSYGDSGNRHYEMTLYNSSWVMKQVFVLPLGTSPTGSNVQRGPNTFSEFLSPGTYYLCVEGFVIPRVPAVSGSVTQHGAPCIQVDVTGGNPPPDNPTTTLQAKKTNGGTYTNGPLSVETGEDVTLQWTSTNASTCTFSNNANPVNGAWNGSTSTNLGDPTPSSASVGGVQVNTLFTLTCSNSSGSSTPRSVQVNVTGVPPSDPDLVANAQTSSQCGKKILVTWNSIPSATNATYVYRSLGGNWVNVAALDPYYTSFLDTTPLANSPYSYRVDADGPSGTVDSAVSNVAYSSADCVAFDYSLAKTSPVGDLSVVKPSSGSALVNATIVRTLTSGTALSTTLSIPATIVPGITLESISSSACSPTCTSVATFRVTSSALVGTYPVVVTSSGGGIADKVTNFNISVTSTPLPDLTASSPWPTTAETGTPLTFSATILNADASTGASFSNFFQVSNSPNGGGTIVDLAPTVMQALPAGGSNTATSPSYTFSSNGTWSIRACADKTSSGNAGTITESNESNNCGAWTNVSVSNPTPPPPQNILSVVCTPSPDPALVNQPVTWTASTSDGVPPYTYSWSGTNIPTSPAPSSNPYTISYQTIGLKTAVATVTDSESNYGLCNAPSPNVRVNFNPKLEEF